MRSDPCGVVFADMGHRISQLAFYKRIRGDELENKSG